MSISTLFYPNSCNLFMNSCTIDEDLVTSNMSLNGTTGATSTSTGSFQVVGGVGIGENLYVGGNSKSVGVIVGNTSGGTITIGNSSINDTNGILNIESGDKKIHLGDTNSIIYIDSSKQANSLNDAALSIYGGVYVNNNIRIMSTEAALNITSGSIVTQGGISIGSNCLCAGNSRSNSITCDNDAAVGGLISTGGINSTLQIKSPITLKSGGSLIEYYQDFYTSMLIGGALMGNIPIRFIRFGNMVTIIIYTFSGVGLVEGTIFSSQNYIPSRFLSSTFSYAPICILHGSNRVVGCIEVRGNDGSPDVGRIVFYSSVNLDKFGQGNDIAIYSCSITYNLV